MSELTTLFQNIANAIRSKGGTSEQISAANFPTAITNIPADEVLTESVYSTGQTITAHSLNGKENFIIALTPQSKKVLKLQHIVGTSNMYMGWTGSATKTLAVTFNPNPFTVTITTSGYTFRANASDQIFIVAW